MCLKDLRDEFIYDCECRHLAKGSVRNYKAATRFLLEYLLHMLAEKGEPFTLQFIKKTLLAEPDGDYSQKDGHLLLK